MSPAVRCEEDDDEKACLGCAGVGRSVRCLLLCSDCVDVGERVVCGGCLELARRERGGSGCCCGGGCCGWGGAVGLARAAGLSTSAMRRYMLLSITIRPVRRMVTGGVLPPAT